MKQYVVIDRNNSIINMYERIDEVSIPRGELENEYLYLGTDRVELYREPIFNGDVVVGVGEMVTPYIQPPSETDILNAKLKASNDRQEFLEELIAEMAMKVYA